MAKTAWGIELGTSSVKAVKLSGDRGGVSLEDVSISSLAEFGLGSGVSASDATAAALQDLRVSHSIKKGDEVYVSISGQNTLGRIISLPPVPAERIRETIENEARSQIPIKLEEAVWDYQVIEDDEGDDELRVNLYAAKKEVVNEIVDLCKIAGLHVTGIQVAPLGIYNYIKYEMDDAVSDVCVAIDIGADNTDVIIIDGQKTYVRVVPVAGNDITRAIRSRFKLKADEAEKLKRRAHKHKDAAAIFESMKPPLKEMVGEIYRAVGFYKSQHEDANINQLVMMGNGSKLLNIKKFFEQQLQYQVHKVDTPVRISLSRSVDPTEVQNNIQSLTVGIGLALQGIGLDEVNTINLLPREYVVDQARTRLRTPFYAAGAIAAAGGLIAMFASIASTAGLSSVTGPAEATAQESNRRSTEYNQATDFEADADKAYSLKNLAEGVVAEVPRDADEEDAEDAGPRELTLQANTAPVLLSRAVQESISDYAERNRGSRLYYATLQGMDTTDDVSLESPDMNATALVVRQAIEHDWHTNPDTGDGHYVATRVVEVRVRVATLLSESLGVSAAYNNLNVAMSDPDNGIIRALLRDAVLAELRQTGQLEGDNADIDFGDRLQVQVHRRQASDFGASGREHFEFREIANPVEFEDPDTDNHIPRNVENDAEFGVSEVVARLTLTPVLRQGLDQ